jgi:hypothetical protein
MTRRQIFPGAFALFVSLILAGCGGSQQQYYRLSAEPAAATHGHSTISLGVGPISLPSYIDRSELVFQSGPNEFQVPPNVSWAGSLSDNIAAVLARDLQEVLGSREVLTAPWPAGRSPQRRVALDIRQFHGISGEGAILDAAWQIQDAAGLTISHGSGRFHEPIDGDGYAAVVAAESRLLAQCAAAIAPSLR